MAVVSTSASGGPAPLVR